MASPWLCFLLATSWLLIFAADARAYIDPSAGGTLLQLLLGGTAGVAVLLKLYWSRIRTRLGLKPKHDAAPDEPRAADNDRV